MNDENLLKYKPGSSLARENGRKGAKAKAKKCRQNKSMREVFQQIKNLPVKDSKLTKQLHDVGITDEDTTYAAAMAWSTIYHAMRGNSQMMRLAMEMLGEDASIAIRERELAIKEKQIDGGDDVEATIIELPAKE